MMEDPCSSKSNVENADLITKTATENRLELKSESDREIKKYKANQEVPDDGNEKKDLNLKGTENLHVNENKIIEFGSNTTKTSKECDIEISKDYANSGQSHREISTINKDMCCKGLSDSVAGPSSYCESSTIDTEKRIEVLTDYEGGPSSFVPPNMLMSACSMTTSYNSDADDLSISQFSEDLSSGKFDNEYGQFDSIENKEEFDLLENPEEMNLKENDKDEENQKRDAENTEISEGGKKKKRRKKKNKNKVGSQGNEEEVKKINIRPNFFVGIQISNPKIHEEIVKVQEDLFLHESNIYRALVDVATAHITLLVAHLPDETAVSLASSTLEKFGEEFSEKLTEDPLCLTFKGLSHFSNQTLYVKMVEDAGHQLLMNLAERLREIFDENGVCMPDKKALHPHLTIAKLSKAPRGKGKLGLRKIDATSYENHVDKDFGAQKIIGFQLLSMNKPKDEKRYFYNSKNFPLDIKLHESLDHNGCCFPRRPVIKDLERTVETQQVKRKLSTSSQEIPRYTSSNESEWITRTARVMALGVALLTAAIIIPRLSRT